jgi:hypothetical protein
MFLKWEKFRFGLLKIACVYDIGCVKHLLKEVDLKVTKFRVFKMVFYRNANHVAFI